MELEDEVVADLDVQSAAPSEFDLNKALEDIMDEAELPAAAVPDESMPPHDGADHVLSDLSDDSEDVDDNSPPVVPDPKPDAAAVGEAHLPGAPEEPDADGDDVLPAGSWGCCRITPKTSASGDQIGWQARCPFHRLNKKSECKKVFRIEGIGPEAKWQCAQRIKWWLARHADFKFQRTHMQYDAPFEDCPVPDFLDAVKPEEAPVKGTIKTDVELDAEEAALEALAGPMLVAADVHDVAPPPPPEALPRGRGRGGKGRGRGRAKARGKGPG